MIQHTSGITDERASRSRVLFVSNTAFSLYNFRLGVMLELLAAGYEVIAVAPHDPYAEKLERAGIPYLELRMSARGANPLEEVQLLFRLTRLFRRLRPTAVFNYTIKPVVYGSLAARLAGVTSVAVVTGLGYAFMHQNWVTRMARALLQWALRFPREVWVINPDDGRVLHEYAMARPEQFRQLFGEGVNLDHFQPLPWHEEAEIRFLFLGRMLRDKGVVEFVEAARLLKPRYPRARFWLLGAAGADNPTAIDHGTIDAWVAQGFIEYLGVTEDVRPYIGASDCVVLPSYREGAPRTLMEASAMARPIVTTDSPGCREVVVDGRTGYLCQPRDAQDLASKMERLIELPFEAKMEMGRRGREYIRSKFDERQTIDAYMASLAKT